MNNHAKFKDSTSIKDGIKHDEKESIRLNKYISESGIASRRESDRIIEDKRVKINGVIAKLGSKITKDDIVTVDDKPITGFVPKVYMALNKPIGIISTTDTSIDNNLITFMNYPDKIFMVGRLDKNTSGLILLTNDGDIVNKILRVENGHEKEYLVKVDKKITNEFVTFMQDGVMIYNPSVSKFQKTNPSRIEIIDDYCFKLIISQGLNRQIRRMVDALGYKVVELKRIRIMHIKLDDLEVGYYRYLTKEELEKLNEAIK